MSNQQSYFAKSVQMIGLIAFLSILSNAHAQESVPSEGLSPRDTIGMKQKEIGSQALYRIDINNKLHSKPSAAPNLRFYTGTGSTKTISYNETTYQLNVTASVENNGTGPAGSFRVGWYCSINPLPSSGPAASDFLVTSATQSSLANGTYIIKSGSIDLDNVIGLPRGNYYVTLYIDDLKQVTELFEGDNTAAYTPPTTGEATIFYPGEAAFRPALTVDPMTWRAPPNGGTSPPVNITSLGSGATITYTISDDATWLTTSSSGGTTPGSFTMTATANVIKPTVTRTAKVTVTATAPLLGDNIRTITVTQSPPTSPASIMPVSPATVTERDTFWVDIKAGDPQPVSYLFAASFELLYNNTAYVDYLEAKTDSLFLGTDLVQLVVPDDAHGKVSVGLSRKAPASEVNGSGILVRLRFRALAGTPNNTPVIFNLSSNITASDSSGMSIPLKVTKADTTMIRSCFNVWPGDTNNDGTVNQADVLPIGLRWGCTLPARSNPMSWPSQYCSPPSTCMIADANGDGVVNQADILPIGLGWGKTHALGSPISEQPRVSAKAGATPSLRAVGSAPLKGETEFYVDLCAGDSKTPVSDLFGVSFVMDLAGAGSDVQVLEMTPGAFFGDKPLFLSKINAQTGAAGCGISLRAGQEGVSGSGVVARVKMKMVKPVSGVSLTIRDVSAIDANGNPVGLDGMNTMISSGSKGGGSIPTNYILYQNHPNPFNPTTAIRYSLPKAGSAALQVYDGRGRTVAVLAEGYQEAGEHEVLFDAKGLTSGMYYYRLQAGSVVLTKRLTLIR